MNPGPIETAFTNVFLNPEVLLVIFAAAAYGIFMGAVPGLTATMAVALLIPLTYFMDTPSALAAVVTLVASAIFAGDIPNTLLRLPGTPSSAAYTDDAYALTRAGFMPASQFLAIVEAYKNETDASVCADLADSLVRLNEIQNAYTAALQSGGLLMKTSLLDYIR